VRFSFSGILEYLDGELFINPMEPQLVEGFSAELASTDRQRVPPEEFASPGHFLMGEELDLEIGAAGLLPSDFWGVTLPSSTTVREEAALSSDILP
jgi:hypothetical protein